ncbi:MAG: ABC transporter ATP-binding protein [Eubacteriales bacterium]|nr:ABC transporter ATP-binding protein [Eubacteriales bacterium]
MIEVRGLCKNYGRGETCVHAVREVSLTLKKGGFLAVMGASGSGKTTLMNILGCLDTQTKGDYIFAGTNVRRLSKEGKVYLRSKRIGFIFQSFYLLPSLNARQNIELPMVYCGVPPKERKRKSAELLEMTGLTDRASHFPNELSGGQRQRVAIARALVNSPSLILADEPTGNLDSRTGEEIVGILRNLNAQGATIILITHEKNIAASAKELIVLKDGRIIENAEGS